MTTIHLVRGETADTDEAIVAGVRRFLTDTLVGVTEADRRKIYRFLYRVRHAEPGTLFKLTTAAPRSAPFHRRHMAIESAVFFAQDFFEDFDKGFRPWLKVGAGHCDYFPGPSGALFPVPKSTSYDELEDGEMREFHDAAMRFLHSEYAARTLWPHLPALQAMNTMAAVLSEFDQPKRKP